MIYQMNIPDSGQEEEHGHVPGVHADDEPHRSPMPEFYGKVKKNKSSIEWREWDRS